MRWLGAHHHPVVGAGPATRRAWRRGPRRSPRRRGSARRPGRIDLTRDRSPSPHSLHRRQHMGDPLAQPDHPDPIGRHRRTPSVPGGRLPPSTRSRPAATGAAGRARPRLLLSQAVGGRRVAVVVATGPEPSTGVLVAVAACWACCCNWLSGTAAGGRRWNHGLGGAGVGLGRAFLVAGHEEASAPAAARVMKRFSCSPSFERIAGGSTATPGGGVPRVSGRAGCGASAGLAPGSGSREGRRPGRDRAVGRCSSAVHAGPPDLEPWPVIRASRSRRRSRSRPP